MGDHFREQEDFASKQGATRMASFEAGFSRKEEETASLLLDAVDAIDRAIGLLNVLDMACAELDQPHQRSAFRQLINDIDDKIRPYSTMGLASGWCPCGGRFKCEKHI